MNPTRTITDLTDLLTLEHALADPPTLALIDAGLRELDRIGQAPALRVATVRALWGGATPTLRTALSRLLRVDPDADVRLACAQAAQLDAGFPADDLVHASLDPHARVRATALHALRLRQAPTLAAAVFRALDDVDAEVVAAAQALVAAQSLAIAPPAPLRAGVLARLRARGAELLGAFGRAAAQLTPSGEAQRAVLARVRQLGLQLLDVQPATASRSDPAHAMPVRATVIADQPLAIGTSTEVQVCDGKLELATVRARLELRDARAAEQLAGGFVVVSLRAAGQDGQEVKQEVFVGQLPEFDDTTKQLAMCFTAPWPSRETIALPAEAWQIELFHRRWATDDAAPPAVS